MGKYSLKKRKGIRKQQSFKKRKEGGWGETFFGIKNAIDQKFDENLAKKLRKQLKPENENLWKLEIIKDKLKTIPNSDEEIKATIKDKDKRNDVKKALKEIDQEIEKRESDANKKKKEEEKSAKQQKEENKKKKKKEKEKNKKKIKKK